MKRVIIFILMIGLCSCSKSIKEIITETENATFTIYTYNNFGTPKGVGSGFFIEEKGIGITNYHVLDGAIKASIKTINGKEYEIDKVLASDKNWDVLKFSIKNLDNEKFKTLNFTDNAMEKGDIVYNISSPLGLENTVSNGIVSSVREDRKHGDIVQVTAPISPGSSGSALLNKKGDVFAIATFLQEGGQNLNFGVVITSDKLNSLEKNDFRQNNLKFNNNENFVIINMPSKRGGEILLNALEFTATSTIGYFTYTNLQLGYGNSMAIWTNTDKEQGDIFTVEDTDTKKKYYIQSSTIGTNREEGTSIPLGSSYNFKIFFDPLPKSIKNIDIYEGCKSNNWSFLNIDLQKYQRSINIDRNKYQKEYAYSILQEGNTEEAEIIMKNYLEENPADIEILNALGIIEYAKDNNAEAITYFGKAIDIDPINSMSYLNRYSIYLDQGKKQEALRDINQAIKFDSDQIDNYLERAKILIQMSKYDDAIKDLNQLSLDKEFKTDEIVYFLRAFSYMELGYKNKACDDIYKAYNLTKDSELEKTLEDMWNKCGCK